jgi:hypothetical protein
VCHDHFDPLAGAPSHLFGHRRGAAGVDLDGQVRPVLLYRSGRQHHNGRRLGQRARVLPSQIPKKVMQCAQPE